MDAHVVRLYHLVVPRVADHEARRREILDAVTRITLRGGLAAATFREVAAEAGVSVRLIQYYFGAKADLLLATQRCVAERATDRLRRHLDAAGESPREVLTAVLTSFLPADDESRTAMLMFISLHTAALLDPKLRRPETAAVPQALQQLIAGQLRRARLRAGVDPDQEAVILTAIVPSLAQAVLDGSMSVEAARAAVGYALDRALIKKR